MLRYQKLVARPQQVFRFTGLRPEQFAALATRLDPLWRAAEHRRLARPTRRRAIGAGRQYTLAALEDKLLCLLVFYRLYLTEDLLSYLFGLHRSNVNRLFSKLEPLLAEAADPSLRAFLRDAKRQRRKIGRWEDFVQAYPDLAEVITDTTEQPRQRPSTRWQRDRYYSGKRKRHTLKTQLTVSRQGRILHVAAPVPGRIHDYRLFQRLDLPARLPPESRWYLDRGYDGAATAYPRHTLILPVKRRNHRPLLPWEWLHNVWQAKKRIGIEHVLCRMKQYQVLAQVYRHRRARYGAIVHNIAALVNFRTQPVLCVT